MADLVKVPQFKIPFEIANNEVQEIEQDSATDRYQNVVNVLRYEKGERTALPEYGIPDQAMRENGVDQRQIISDVQRWEPDADVQVIQEAIDSGVATAQVIITASDDGTKET